MRQYAPYAGCAPPLSFVLRAGDALFIPRDWFHAVRSLDVSVSANVFTARSRPGDARRAPGPDDFAHNRLGLWRATVFATSSGRRGTVGVTTSVFSIPSSRNVASTASAVPSLHRGTHEAVPRGRCADRPSTRKTRY